MLGDPILYTFSEGANRFVVEDVQDAYLLTARHGPTSVVVRLSPDDLLALRNALSERLG